MGGPVTILLAVRHPALVRSLVLVDSNLEPAAPTPGFPGSRGMAAYSEAAFVAAPDAQLEARYGTEWWATMRLASRVAVHRSAVSLIQGCWREPLCGLSIPRTFLYPAGAAPPESLREAGVRLVEIPGAGHNLMLDNAPAFAAATALHCGRLA
jgi:pimeloyl-ACP methyl ester carboxylesterase